MHRAWMITALLSTVACSSAQNVGPVYDGGLFDADGGAVATDATTTDSGTDATVADSGGGDTAGDSSGPTSISVAPSSASLLTCATQTFTATGADDASADVKWSVAPASGAGTITTTGDYTAPKATPSPATATVTATSRSDATVTATASVTLGTAFPSAPVSIPGSTALTAGVFPHSIAAQGQRVYSVWPSAASGTPSLQVARSDDGGMTWGGTTRPPTTVAMATLASGMDSFDCAAIAIDAGNPDVVYVYGRLGDPNSLGSEAAEGTSGETSIFAVSTDKGATFTVSVMQVGGTAGGPHGGWDSVGICGDVSSPSPDTVVVESPGGYGGDGNPDIAIWSDPAKGAGFGTGMADDGDYLADGYTDALDDLLDDHEIDVRQNGGSDDAGGATESPRLFTDGSGRLCITYFGQITASGHTQSHAYVQCSTDAAKTFSPPLVLDPMQPTDAPISSPVGALGPSSAAAVLWTTGLTGGQLLIATSTNAGTSFAAPKVIPTYTLPADGGMAAPLNPTIAYDAAGLLWIAYRAYDGGTHQRVIVDKSCNGGKTWSGPVLVNGPEGSIVDMRFPAFATTSDAAPHLVATAMSSLSYFSLTP